MDYTDKVMDHFMNPRNMGDMDSPSSVGTVGNAACGDIMKLYLKIENDTIIDAKFKTFGCGAAIATSSASTELILGKTLKEAVAITNDDVVKELGGLPKSKVHCSVLAKKALNAALWDYTSKNNIELEGVTKPTSDDDDHHHHDDEE